MFSEKDEAEINRVKKEIEERKLDKKLLMGVLQLPVNIALAERYFALVRD